MFSPCVDSFGMEREKGEKSRDTNGGRERKREWVERERRKEKRRKEEKKDNLVLKLTYVHNNVNVGQN